MECKPDEVEIAGMCVDTLTESEATELLRAIWRAEEGEKEPKVMIKGKEYAIMKVRYGKK